MGSESLPDLTRVQLGGEEFDYPQFCLIHRGAGNGTLVGEKVLLLSKPLITKT